jgi:outer membrane receptor protein involved in Fe transport
MSNALRVRRCLLILVLCALTSVPTFAQMETATLSGAITDPNGRVVPDVEVAATRIETGTVATTKTNGAGIYFFTGLMPGHYHLMIRKPGFKEIAIKEFQLNVQDKLEQNFTLEIGSISETVTVEAGALTIDTQDAAVSTVVDRHFAENLPMNGRSFQTLIELTPGVVVTPSNHGDSGQFSINGQRAASNYWMVDGVSANVGIGMGASAIPGNGLAGAAASLSALGGTNSLVSVDALQEFRIQTSTYAPEFGRTPGGQISIVTRSGTNQFHGTAFDYVRNDVFDANDWFNGVNILNPTPLPKAKERQNDFGGTFSGPVLKDKTFFFFSYEGLRLRLPQTELTTVPDLAARHNAVPSMQPFLNAYPFDPNQPDLGNGVAQFNESFSDPATLDAYSLRVDHKLSSKLNLFGRYNYSPSENSLRGNGEALSVIAPTRITIQTGTVGLTWAISATAANDLRFNYSRTDASSHFNVDNFGGATPLTSLPFPSPFTIENASLAMSNFALQGPLVVGQNGRNLQRQINIVDGLSIQNGRHSLKFGFDFRRLSPQFSQPKYTQFVNFFDVPSAETGSVFFGGVFSNLTPTFLFRNLGIYAQDTWRIAPRLTVTYGLRWDVDFVPRSLNGLGFNAVTGFNLTDLSKLALEPPGTAPYKTTYGNFGPRVGLAYQLTDSLDWQTVFRGGFGVFYDLATSEMGNNLGSDTYPFGSQSIIFGGTFPFDSATAQPAPITPPTAANGQNLFAFDPQLKLPYTLEWNVAIEQAVGKQQTISVSYVGASGRRLLETAQVASPNPNFGNTLLVTNAGTSNYNALQLQFQRRLSRGLQALASYTWAHSFDTGSAGSIAVATNSLVPSGLAANRGPSDFDIRNAFSAGVTYDIPSPKSNAFVTAVLHEWSVDNVIQVRSAPPVTVESNTFNGMPVQGIDGFTVPLRPDVVPGQPLYLFGSQYPGGKALNPAAFTAPPIDPMTGQFVQGNLGRNSLRGFGASQWDFAVHRDFPVRESLRLQFRAEMFNVLNHPNFGQPDGTLTDPHFGLSTQMLGQSLSGGPGGNLGGGAFSPLYQIGGPRSMQLALKLIF